MIRTIVFSSLLLVACSFIQSTWLGAIAILGIVPDLSLIVLIWLSYKNGLVEGSASGFIAGFAEDFLSAAPLGLNAFVKTLIASCAGLLHGVFSIDRIVLPFVLGFIGTVVKALSTGLLALLFAGKVRSYAFLGRALWIEAAYNGLVAPLIFILLSGLKRFLVTKRGRE